ncbi:MAG: glycosyltransferase family 9 protein [Pirellulales bacterium]|nr:glycosyltransferase family 9 protein [Pirellulales bacterium]
MRTERSFDPQTLEYRYVRRRWHVLLRAIDTLGLIVMRLLGGGNARLGSRTAESSPPDPAQVRSMLLVQLDHLGDAVITTAMFAPLRRQFPHASIEVLCGPRGAEVFRGVPEVTQVHVSGVNRFHRRLAGLWMVSTLWWGWKLRRRKFDLAIDVRGELPMALLIALTGARQRLGWDAGGGGFMLTASPPYVPGRAELHSRAALLELLGVVVDRENFFPSWSPSVAIGSAIDWRLRNAGYDAKRRLIVLHLGAGTQAKRWPIDRWRSLVCSLVSRELGEVILVGSAADQAAAQEIVGGFGSQYVRDWTGQLDLAELAALCGRADIVVGADSGPAHLAAAQRTPVVVLFSGTNDVEQWRPRSGRVAILREPVSCSPCHATTCPLADHPCMRGLDPDAVLQAVAEMLDEPMLAFADFRNRLERSQPRRDSWRSIA